MEILHHYSRNFNNNVITWKLDRFLCCIVFITIFVVHKRLNFALDVKKTLVLSALKRDLKTPVHKKRCRTNAYVPFKIVQNLLISSRIVSPNYHEYIVYGLSL